MRANRPNLVFILSDDLGWADTQLYGQTKLYQTPNLLRLARRGMLFTRAYSASPLCSPARASILTGQTPARTGVTAPNAHLAEVRLFPGVQESAPATSKVREGISATRLRTEYVTLAERLKAEGYATGHFGKWHLGAEPYSPLQQGFEVDVPHTPGPGPAGSFVAPWRFPNFKERTPGEHIEDRMADEAVAWLEKHKEGPFFLNYWQFSVHAPFDAKKALIEKYRSRVDPKSPQRSPTYAAMVESMDESVGKLLDALDRLGLAQNTAVIFLADNGGNMYNTVDGTTPTSNAPLRGGKATLWEGGIRVPCIVSWPGVTCPGSKSETRLQSTDFYPTILELLQLAPTPNHPVDGVSLVPALKGKRQERPPSFTYFPHSPAVPDTLPPGITVHAGDWKLFRLFHQGERGAHRYQLYHLKSDPGERNDLAARQPERVKQLDGLIEAFLKDAKTVVPLPNTNVDPLDGWKARGCEATVKNGVLTITGTGPNPFLGFAAGRRGGTTVVSFRVRSKAGGAGKVEWLPTPTAAEQAKSVPFSLDARPDWQEHTVTLPAEGPLGVLRLYLPAQRAPVELEWIDVRPTQGPEQRWRF